MTVATSPLQFPLINGAGLSYPSIELKINGLIFRGFKSINYDYSRERTKVYGNSPDPLFKTTGKADYTCDAEIYLAEWNAFLAQLGAGFGDVFFPILVSYTQPGFDPVQDSILGCTIDKMTASQSEGPDPLVRKVEFNPLKILYNGKDPLAIPLAPPPQ